MFLFRLVFEAGVGFRIGARVVIGVGLVLVAGVGDSVEVRVTIGFVLGGALGLLITFCVFRVTPGDSIDILPFD